jgi:hypothetical protein
MQPACADVAMLCALQAGSGFGAPIESKSEFMKKKNL